MKYFGLIAGTATTVLVTGATIFSFQQPPAPNAPAASPFTAATKPLFDELLK